MIGRLGALPVRGKGRAHPIRSNDPTFRSSFQLARADASDQRKEIVMPDPAALPQRPSLEQLRKQAKDLLRAWRDGDAAAAQRVRAQKPRAREPVLADAQFTLAREHGFESWPKLALHVEALKHDSVLRLARTADDIVAMYTRHDKDALERLSTAFGGEQEIGRVRESIASRVRQLPDGEQRLANLTSADVRLLLARQLGFDDWWAYIESAAQPPENARSAPRGYSATPPFYRIDFDNDSIEPRQLMSRKDWEGLIDAMRDTGVSGLNARGQMTDDIMALLTALDGLKRLNLGGCRALTDAGVAHLAKLPQLEELELAGRITDKGLEVLRHLPELRKFQLFWHTGVSDAGVANLTFCDKLEHVDMLGSTTGDGAINALRGKRHLQHLKTGRLVTDAGLPLLHDLPLLKQRSGLEAKADLMAFDADRGHLMLDGPITNAGLGTLAGLEGVRGFHLFWHAKGVTSDALGVLRELPGLGFLGCEGTLCDDTAMRHIAAMPRLRVLQSQGAVATDDGFAALAKSRTIEAIWGRENPNLRGRGFAALAEMPALTSLAVSCQHVDDAALSLLPRFPKLTWLVPIGVSDDGFEHVGRCERLEKLTCMYCRDTGDRASEQIASLTKLRYYYAGQTQITDRSLEILGGMSSLEEVELSACKSISNAGLAHIAKLPRLRKVAFDATPHVSRAALALFAHDVRVDFWT
jgi:hypothetical protein